MPRQNPLGSLIDIVGAFRPVDLQTGANNGDYVSMKNYAGILVVFHSAIGTAGDDPTLNIDQATDNAGAGSKDLSVSGSARKVFKKQAATDLLSTGVWSLADSDISGGNWTNATSAEEEALVTIWIDASDLDVANGFDFIRATVADVGTNAQLGACYYIGLVSYPNDPRNVLSPL